MEWKSVINDKNPFQSIRSFYIKNDLSQRLVTVVEAVIGRSHELEDLRLVVELREADVSSLEDLAEFLESAQACEFVLSDASCALEVEADAARCLLHLIQVCLLSLLLRVLHLYVLR